MKKNLVVLFGGKSTEHDISILTACQIMSAVDKEKYNLIPVYIDNFGKWFTGSQLTDVKFYTNFNEKKLKRAVFLPDNNFLWVQSLGGYKKHLKIDCAIVACHGKNGEDGTVQGLLELSSVPYSSSGVLGSALGIDKIAMKQIFKSENISVCDFVTLSKHNYKKDAKEILKHLTLPVIVKPNTLGSSIGISIAKTEEELFEAIDLAFMFDNNILIEQLVQNLKEINISVMGDGEDCVCSVTEEPQNKGEFLSFANKYLSEVSSKKPQKQSGMQNLSRTMPANISKDKIAQIEKLAKQVFVLLRSKGVVRIDFLMDTNSEQIFVNEINTIPGSFAFYLWEKSGLSFDKLVDRLVEIAENSTNRQNKLTTSFVSSVLNGSCGAKSPKTNN